MYTIEFELREIPLLLNKLLRLNRHPRNEYNKIWYTRISLATMGKRPRTPLKKVKISVYRFHERMADYDGVVGSFKPVIDGLVHARIIEDDSFKITGPWDVNQFKVTKKRKKNYS